MKNIFQVLVFAALAAFSTTTLAQVNGNAYGAGDQNLGDLDALEQKIAVSINLETILQLNAPEDQHVRFTFDEIDEFKQGIRAEDPTNGGSYISNGVVNGTQKFSVDATVNWKLDWRADIDGDYVKGHNAQGNREQVLALNNVGAKFNTRGSRNEIRPTDGGAIALTNSDFTVIEREEGHSNIGAAEDNVFTIDWRVGTQEKPENASTPAMNEKSLLEQQIGSEAFSFNVILTLSQDDPWIKA